MSVSLTFLQNKKIMYPAYGVAAGLLVGAIGSYLIKGRVCGLCVGVSALAFGAGGYYLGSKAPAIVTVK